LANKHLLRKGACGLTSKHQSSEQSTAYSCLTASMSH